MAQPPPPHIVVLRGPAGSGKSTVSAGVLAAVRSRGGRGVAYLEQDFFRNTVCAGGKGAREAARDMLVASARAAHAAGFSVLIEGILSKPHHGAALAQLGAELPLFYVYLNVPLEETKARHAGRAKAADFGAEKLEEWWASAEPLGVAGELLVPGDSPLEATVAAVAALLAPPPLVEAALPVEGVVAADDEGAAAAAAGGGTEGAPSNKRAKL
jgi:hypothetical protein